MTRSSTTPLLTQVRPTYFSADCGMCYIMRTGGGRFIIIDGNFGEYDEPDRLYSLLCEQNETDGKPVIAAWFITHPHADHFGGFTEFFKKYKNDVVLEKVLYHFPTPGVFDNEGSDKTEFLSVLSELDTEIVTPHTNDVFTFDDARFEVLFTCEDLYPGPVNNINNSSLVMTMELGCYRVLWLGDLQREGAEYICANVEKTRLKCDILQVGHHGYGGGNDELHRAAAPEILLWPCPDFWFHSVRLWESNDYLIHSEKIRATFVAGQQENVFDLTLPIEYTEPYPAPTVCPDLTKKSVCALGWSCLTGGRTGYAPAKLEFTDGGCRLTSGDALTLCQMIQRGQTEKYEKYSFEFSGKVNSAELFGIIFDVADPMKPCESSVVALTSVGEFSYRLEVNKKDLTAVLYESGKKLGEWKDLCSEPCEIVLVMKNASVELTRVAYEA